MRFYDALYDTVAAAEASGAPTRTWVLKTNEYGFCYLDTPWLVSGDELYYAENGDPTLPIGTVLMQETKAPEGYFINDEVYLVKITESGADQAIIGTYNAPITPEQVLTGNIQITKATRTGLDKHVIPEDGAVFEIYLKSAGSYANAAETDRALLTTDANGVALAADLPYGTYTIHQVSGWEGSALCDDFDVTIDTNGKTYSYDIENERFYSKVQLVKLDSRTGLPIPEANVGFQIKYPNGSLVSYNGTDTWYTDATGTLTLPMELEYGKVYQAIEINAPDGYVLSSTPINFDVTADAATTLAGETVILVDVNNTPTSVEVSKTNAAGNGVSGAKLQVLNNAGTVVDEWITNGTVHMIYALSIGGSYRLHEATAPTGYVLAKDVAFTVADTTDIQPVSMTNKQVFIEKLDADGNSVQGATLQILDSEGTVVDEWGSNGNPHATNNLVIGERYTLRESAAPAGYVKAEDIPFTVAETAENETFSMTNKQVLIQKLDAAGSFIVGAKLQILDSAGNMVDEWTTGNTAYGPSNLVIGEPYTLRETEAPAGYVKAKDVVFTIEKTSDTQTVSMVDKQVVIEKVDADGNFVTGAKLQILDSAGTVVDEWTTDGTAHTAKNLAVGERYTLRETDAPAGYVKAKDLSFTVTATTETQTVSMVDKKVVVEKVDAAGNGVSGAKLQILDAAENVVDEWTTDGTPHVAKGLVVGERYTLREVSTPVGYVQASRMTFLVTADNATQTVSMTDKQVLISKVTADGSALSGATMQILDSKGMVVDTWVTGKDPHAAKSLVAGLTYTLHEAEAPEGYVRAADVEFTVADDGKNQSISVVDKQVFVKKVDANGDFVIGAKLQILDSAGTVVDEWTTSASAHATNNLLIGETYTLHEEETPAGYVTAKDISFFVSVSNDVQTVSMTDMRVLIEKVDAGNNALSGAKMQILDASGTVIDEWATNGSVYAVIGLKAGESYTLHEAEAPAGYVRAKDISFIVEDDGKDQSYTVIDKQVMVEKLDADGNFVSDAKLQILDSAGNVVDEWTTDDKPHAVCDLLIGESYTLHEAETPEGYVTAQDIPFTVAETSATQTVTMTNMQVFVSKVDVNGMGLSGAKMQILDANDKVVHEWTTDGKVYAVSGLIAGERYVLHEAEAPAGYVRAADIHFTVENDEKNQSYTVVDKQVFVEKLDADGNFVIGAKLQVLDSEGTVVDEWESSNAAHAISNLLIGQDYTLHEASAPDGYVLANDIAFSVTVKAETQPVSMTDKRILIAKLDGNNAPLSGATLQILDSKGDVVDEWVTDGTTYAATGLRVGETYTLHEEKAPAGYVRAADIQVKVEDDGKDQNYSLIDKQVLVEKLNADGNFVTGAKLQVLDADGKLVDEWISDGTPHAVSNLLIGESYTLHEVKAPAGYVCAADISFTIEDDGKNQSYTMIDKQVMVEKLDADGNFVTGAKLQILDADGKVVDEWTTDDAAHAVSNLLIGEDYTLHEAETPEGYVTAKDILFTVALTPETQTVTMTDMQIFVEKVDVNNAGLSGAKMQILDANDKVVYEWTTDGSPHAIIGLKASERYVIHEAAAPAGYVRAADMHFTVEDDGKNQNYTVTDKQVFVEKLDADGNFVRGAKLQVLDADGKVVDEWASDDKAHAVSNLLIGKDYTLREAGTPDGYVKANDVSFTVAVKSETQTVSMTDKKLFVEKVDPYGNAVKGATLQVLDDAGTVIDEWASDGTSYAVIGLEAGKSYVLHEDVAPDGWLLSYDLPFTVEDDGLDQTVRFENEEIPLLRSMATVDERHEAFAKADITLTDVVSYEKLVPGREYVVKGTLIDQETGEPLKNEDGEPITSSVTFTPSESSGFIVVPFTYTPIAGSTVVVYQQIYKNDRLLASHEDIEDENQTVHFPSIDSSAMVNEKKEISCTSEMTLVDIVYYQNLEVGREYTVTGLLMDKRTGEAYAAKKDAEPITASVTFTPESTDGSVSLTFELTSAQFSRTTTLVVFDELYDGDYLVAEHGDIEDEDQTVEIRVYYGSPEDVDPADSGDLGIALYVALANISYIGSCLLIRRGRERK